MDQDKVALVTMASEHGSPAVAKLLAQSRFRLMLQGADLTLVRELRDLGADVTESSEDLLTPESAKRCVASALSKFGRIDAAWIRTGLVVPEVNATFMNSSQSLWEALKLHNIDMLVYVLQALLPSMIAVGQGQVVVSTSATGIRPQNFAALYSATRAAAVSLVRSVGLELATTGVCINAIATAFLDVPVFLRASGADTPEGRKRVESSVPMHRLGSPEEFAEFALVLLDGRTRFQTGQCFSFSGGWSP